MKTKKKKTKEKHKTLVDQNFSFVRRHLPIFMHE